MITFSLEELDWCGVFALRPGPCGATLGGQGHQQGGSAVVDGDGRLSGGRSVEEEAVGCRMEPCVSP